MTTFSSKTLTCLLSCSLIALSTMAWADITAAPSGATPVSGVLVPQSGDTVTVDSTGGTNVVSIDNDAALNVTVNVTDAATLEPADTKDAINLGEDATINISSTGIVKGAGAIVIRGKGNSINNDGEILSVERDGIQGNLSKNKTDGAFLSNSGKILTVAPSSTSVNLGNNSTVINYGEIRLEGGNNRNALSVSSNSTVVNETTGLIEAKEVVGATRGVNAVSLNNLGVLTNKGTIRLIGDINGSPRGIAVIAFGADVTIENSGTIDASRGSKAISGAAEGQYLIDNSGTIIGGLDGAISLPNSEGSEVTLKPGSQITGDVLVRVLDRTSVRKTDAELGSQRLIDFCNQDPSFSFCFKSISVLPQNAFLTLEGTGAEDDRLTGFNQIEKRDAGLWTLDSDFQAGSASDFYQTGDFRGTLAVGVVDAGGQLNLTGNITDNADGTKGQLVKNGVGTLALSGTNSYSGATTINGGTLQANGGNAIGDSSAVSVASGAALLVGGNETIGSLAGDGDVLLNGQTLQAGSDNSSTLFNGNISGTGQFGKIGSGTLTLAGNNTSTGVLTVEEGSLNAAGTIPMIVTVGPLGSLYGTGTLGQLVNTGSAAPGNSIGTLTVNNDYLQTAAGTLEIEIAPDGSAANDLLAVGGAANLDGTLSVKGENSTLLTPAVDGNIYTIVTAGGGVNGQFNAAPLLGAFAFSPTYNANDVQLGVTYAGFSAVQNSGTAPGTGTQNQKSKAKALDKPVVHPSGLSFNSGNSDFDQILLEIANETADELANTYNNIIAEPYAAYMTVLLEQNDFFAETVMDRAQVCSVSGRGSLGGDFTQQPDTADGNAPVGCGSTAGDRPHGAWVDATWVKGDVDGDDGLSGYDYRMTGLLAGVDTAFSSNFAGGLAVGYGQPELDSYDLADAEIDGDSYFLSTYGTFTRKNLEIAGLLGYTFGEYDGERRIRFGSIDRTAKGEFDGDGVIASAKAAYFYKVDNYDLVPELGLTYSKIWQDGFTEKGANSLNLKVDDADAYSVVTSAGMRIATVLQKGETRIRPHALLRYEYDWNAGNDEDHDLEATFAEVPIIGSIDVVGQNRGENGVVVSGGATVQITKKVDIFADGGYRWHDNGDEYTFSAGARMVW